MTADCSWNYHENYKRRTHVLPLFCACKFHGNCMNNLLSYCGLIAAKIRASDKDLPAQHSVGLPVRWTVLFYPRKEQDNIIRLITNDLNKSTLKAIKLIGTNSRFAKIQQKAQEQKWLKIEHLAIGLVAKKYSNTLS